MVNTLHTIKCPACQHDMVKIFVPRTGIHVDVCVDGCGGIYFDNREFKQFDEPHEDISEIEKALEGKEFIRVDESLPRSCPVCGAMMVKNYSSIRKAVQVDECYSCGGKFLDHGELQKIRAEYDTEEARSKDVMTYLYATVGKDLQLLEEARAQQEKEKSFFKKLFDKYVTGL